MSWILWGRAACTGHAPIKITGGSLAEVRRERAFRAGIDSPAAFYDLRIRREGAAYGHYTTNETEGNQS